MTADGGRLRRFASRISGSPPAQARGILANSGSLVSAAVVTSILGFPYWSIAARTFQPEAVGFAAAVVATMTLLGTLAMLGLGTLLAGELARGDRSVRLLPPVAIAAAAGLAFGAVFGVAAPARLGLHAMGGKAAPIALFAVGVGLTSASLVIDQALIGLQRGGLQFARNAVFAVSKLALVAAAAVAAEQVGGVGLYGTWVVGLAVSLILVAVVLRHRQVDGARPGWALHRESRTEAIKHHFLNVALQAPSLLMPLVVAATVSVEADAYYYTAALIAGMLAYGAIAISFALYTAGAREGQDLAPMLRFTLRISFAVVIAANVVLLVGAHVILAAFGPGYAAHGATVLRLLGVLVVLAVVKDHYIAIARIRGTILKAGLVCGGGAALEIGLAAIGGALGGLIWLVLGVFAALVLETIVMAPSILRELAVPRASGAGASVGAP